MFIWGCSGPDLFLLTCFFIADFGTNMAAETGVYLLNAVKYSNWLLLSLFFFLLAVSTLAERICIEVYCWLMAMMLLSIWLQRYTSPSSLPQITWLLQGDSEALRCNYSFLFPLIFITHLPVSMLMNLTRESFVVTIAILLLKKSMPVTLRPPENFPLLFRTSMVLSNFSFSKHWAC